MTTLSSEGRLSASTLIAKVSTRNRGPKTGYMRAAFGKAWTDDAGQVLFSHNGCGSRDDVAARDLDAPVKRGRCVVVGGTFVDPYTGQAQSFLKERAGEWPCDHIVPLAYAWQLGAAQWPAGKRVEFANDPLNLVLTTRLPNSAKADSGPASWLPPNKAIRCAYAQRWALVAVKYALPVTAADKVSLLRQCA